MNEGILKNVYPILKLILESFGPCGTVGLLVLLYLMFFGWKKYNEYMRQKEIDAALAEKEKTVQRLANEVRMWRIVELKEKHNWSDEQIERFLITEEFQDPLAARAFFDGVKEKRDKEIIKNE